MRGPYSLTGRTVVVTGAGRGLGRATAMAAAAAGARVIGVARSADQLAECATGADGEVVAVPWDLADLNRIDALADRIGGEVHGVVHAAGTQLRKPSEAVGRAEWQRVLDLNLTAPFLLSAALTRTCPAAGASHVFVGSLTSSIGIAGLAPYAAGKAGLLGVVRTMAVEWAGRGIRANALCPGYVHTELTDAVFTDPARREWVLSRIPMGRTGEPAEIADAAVFLLSAASRYITGQIINVDGGWLAG
ncbi:SDR family NAD(P)-dependent oxidoreductase [Micromonospora sp. NPDC005087]|uniref:SDR family NAD(P)-dependent oxidoreductase n=1 Tax=Micromonospora sp. NPDC005087 TaxID=3364225 RepID=UPI003688673E